MKNREKHKEFLDDCLANGKKFGVNKDTNEPCVCRHLACLDCKFHDLGRSCTDFRKDWLDQEFDPWSYFRDLEQGDLIFIKKGISMYPYVFVNFEDDGILYAACIYSDGCYGGLMKEMNPNLVRRV